MKARLTSSRDVTTTIKKLKLTYFIRVRLNGTGWDAETYRARREGLSIESQDITHDVSRKYICTKCDVDRKDDVTTSASSIYN